MRQCEFSPNGQKEFIVINRVTCCVEVGGTKGSGRDSKLHFSRILDWGKQRWRETIHSIRQWILGTVGFMWVSYCSRAEVLHVPAPVQSVSASLCWMNECADERRMCEGVDGERRPWSHGVNSSGEPGGVWYCDILESARGEDPEVSLAASKREIWGRVWTGPLKPGPGGLEVSMWAPQTPCRVLGPWASRCRRRCWTERSDSHSRTVCSRTRGSRWVTECRGQRWAPEREWRVFDLGDGIEVMLLTDVEKSGVGCHGYSVAVHHVHTFLGWDDAFWMPRMSRDDCGKPHGLRFLQVVQACVWCQTVFRNREGLKKKFFF